MTELAIVIPAYKPEFLGEALRSIERQTDRRFRLYVGDDAGPPRIREICDSFDSLDLTYHRFAENLGGRSLTEHWNRCVSLSAEPWVWLFADDDEMSPDCVEAFHASRPQLGGVDLVRFQTDTIDAEGRVLATNPSHPAKESAEEFVLARLRGERVSFVVEYIFRRTAFERVGGFLDFPVGWCADDATWFEISRAAAIHTLPRGRVRWRASGLNITDVNRSHCDEKLRAALMYLDFVDREVRGREPAPATGSSRVDASDRAGTARIWERAELAWLLGQLRYLMPMSPRTIARTTRLTRTRWTLPAPIKVALLSAWNLRSAWKAARGWVRQRYGRGAPRAAL
jgi:glycosyltransferase involved in cell wall biosynthesis